MEISNVGHQPPPPDAGNERYVCLFLWRRVDDRQRDRPYPCCTHGNGSIKFAADRPYADSVAAARKLVEIANSIEAVQDGRIYIELVNWPFL
jgi:hypothetical protein